MSTCNAVIEIGDSGRKVMYCLLELGHKGKHQAFRDASPISVNPLRCESVHEGMRCGLPNGHKGNHTKTVGQQVIGTWNN